MADNAPALQEQVLAAYSARQPLCIRGSGSKDFYGASVPGPILHTTTHSGIVSYEPAELVLTARAGTPLAEIETALAEHGQMLGCEPPHFGPHATFGGMIAAGLSGPRRPYAGSIADAVLGCRILNGRGEMLRYGGKVMKNVAGFDISRLLTGSLGCLAVILEATVKLLPRPRAECTCRIQISADQATAFANQLTGSGYPVSATTHDGQMLAVRFSAGAEEIGKLPDRLRREFAGIGLVEVEADANYWLTVREQQLTFFNAEPPLWRVSLAPAARLDLPGAEFREWHGALRWFRTEAMPGDVFGRVERLSGSATLFRSASTAGAATRFQPLSPALRHWHRRLKQAFDPAAILNPGRMYPEF